MAISTVDQLVAGFTGARQKLPVSKAAISSMLVGGAGSYWRSIGFPAQGAIPTTAVTCNNATIGGIPYNLPTSGSSTYLARLMAYSSVISTIEVHDRLAHMAGLSGILTTAQTVGIDLNALATTDNIAQRKGRSDFGTVQWWLECYVQPGATSSYVTVNYTNQFGVASTIFGTVLIPANFRAQAMIPIVPTTAGDTIRSIESVTLITNTGTAGNFGVTATVQRTEIPLATANVGLVMDWTALGLPPVYDSSCLFFIGDPASTTLGALNGATTLVQG